MHEPEGLRDEMVILGPVGLALDEPFAEVVLRAAWVLLGGEGLDGSTGSKGRRLLACGDRLRVGAIPTIRCRPT